MGALRFPPRSIFRRLLLSLLIFNKSQGACQLISLWARSDCAYVHDLRAAQHTHTHATHTYYTPQIHHTHTHMHTRTSYISLHVFLRFREKLCFWATLTGFSFLTPGSRARSSCSLFISFTGRLPTYLPFISFIACRLNLRNLVSFFSFVACIVGCLLFNLRSTHA